ncbi:putative Serum paraoxonase/arylesterase 2 [Glarea lozoyensis 74030]|uniref:Putative Serum paraoxonase/arylesterase 2 n=1 Tax=Glarea lozoyensis (strain ATCC 74030 / MF5533) TaxID=1104152 RepID=H0EY17_GLAL7|nr:putative Serum paraoxonase/arylesterase 2 [Glarea lozoyensis 74030]
MVNLASKLAIAGVVSVGVLYQFLIKYLVFDVLGVGRETFSIESYGHLKCEKVEELGIEGYSRSREQWLPAFDPQSPLSVDHLNATGRGLVDRIAVLDTRGSGRLASRIKWLSIENFSGIKGDGTLNLHGLDIRADDNTDVLRILLVNHRPPIDPITGEFLDAAKHGANSTVEQFQTEIGTETMRHVRTYHHDLIQTPNRVAWVSDHSFVFTNDHTHKHGFRRGLEAILGGGNVGYCDRRSCHIAYDSEFWGPNGLVRGKDGLIYVPNVIGSNVQVFALTETHHLRKLHTLKTLPIDNLSVDQNGDIFGAAFPQVYKWIQSSSDAFGVHPPSAVVKISRAGKVHGRAVDVDRTVDDYTVEKIFEDDSGVLPGSTIISFQDAIICFYSLFSTSFSIYLDQF